MHAGKQDVTTLAQSHPTVYTGYYVFNLGHVDFMSNKSKTENQETIVFDTTIDSNRREKIVFDS